jgi:hypothetical protein
MASAHFLLSIMQDSSISHLIVMVAHELSFGPKSLSCVIVGTAHCTLHARHQQSGAEIFYILLYKYYPYPSQQPVGARHLQLAHLKLRCKIY